MRILQAINLKKFYGADPNITRALDGVTFSLEQGEIHGLRSVNVRLG